MGLVYAYLASWVIGGVLVGARILLTHREPEAARDAVLPVGSRATSVAAAALLGFGMFGLVAEGMGLASGLWAALSALAGSGLFALAGLALRPRALTPPAPSVHR